MPKIGILITTFLRNDLLYKSVESLLQNLEDNFFILIGDSGYISNEKKEWILKIKTEYPDQIHYRELPFDCGLSYARNYLVNLAVAKKCDYIILGSDSFLFNKSIKKINNLININKAFDLIGFELKGCICDWEAKMSLIPYKHFVLDFINKKTSSNFIIYDDVKIFNCDIVRNFFIAKTDIVLNTKWDNNLKLREHEDFFWRLKQEYHKIGWTDNIYAEKMSDRPNEYKSYRDTNMYEGLLYLKKKYNINGWVHYINLHNGK